MQPRHDGGLLDAPAAPSTTPASPPSTAEHAALALASLVALVLVSLTSSAASRLLAAQRHAPSAQRRQHHQQQQQQQQQKQQQQQQQRRAGSPRHAGSDARAAMAARGHLPGDWDWERPFRFRAPDGDDAEFAAGPGASGYATPRTSHRRGGAAAAAPASTSPRRRQQPASEQLLRASRTPLGPSEQEAQHGGWDPAALRAFTADPASPHIASLQALQASPQYRRHLRQQRLNYEVSASHKLRVYKALRDVDPQGFTRLFNRSDIKDYEESPPSRLLAAAESLFTSGLALALLLAPALLPRLAPHQAAAAAAWALLQLAAVAAGSTSLLAWAASLHAVHGPFDMLASTPRLLAAVLLEAGLVVSTAGAGALLSLACRLVTAQRQSFSERLLRLAPLHEAAKPMPFRPLPPAGVAACGELSDCE